MRRNDRGEIVVLVPGNIEVSPEILLDEVFLSLIDVDNLLEVTQLQSLVDILQVDYLDDFLVDLLEEEGEEVEQSVYDWRKFALLLHGEVFVVLVKEGLDWAVYDWEGTAEEVAIHVGVVNEGLSAENYCHFFEEVSDTWILYLLPLEFYMRLECEVSAIRNKS